MGLMLHPPASINFAPNKLLSRKMPIDQADIEKQPNL